MLRATMETWKDIEGYEGYYQISDKGRVKSLSRIIKKNTVGECRTTECILKQTEDKRGVRRVSLRKHKHTKIHRVEKLVASAFLNEEKTDYIEHINGNKSDNHPGNLRYIGGGHMKIYRDIMAGVKRANKKHGPPTAHPLIFHAVISEELGEIGKALQDTYNPNSLHYGDFMRVEEEIIDLIAPAIRMLYGIKNKLFEEKFK